MTLLAQKPQTTETMTTKSHASSETKKTRRGYVAESESRKFVYLRRAHPAEPVELCLGKGFHDCQIIKLTNEQLRDIARDAVALHFTLQVKA